MQATIEGQVPVKFAVLEVDPPGLLRTTMSGGNIPGRVETSTVFDRTSNGSTATMTHRGFGDVAGWERFGGSFAAGWDEATTDLMAYVRTGVKLPRHIIDLRASIAAWPVRKDWGVELAEVFPGGFADQAGMKAGDILLSLDRMGVYRIADIWAFTRALAQRAKRSKQRSSGTMRRNVGVLSSIDLKTSENSGGTTCLGLSGRSLPLDPGPKPTRQVWRTTVGGTSRQLRNPDQSVGG